MSAKKAAVEEGNETAGIETEDRVTWVEIGLVCLWSI